MIAASTSLIFGVHVTFRFLDGGMEGVASKSVLVEGVSETDGDGDRDDDGKESTVSLKRNLYHTHNNI